MPDRTFELHDLLVARFADIGGHSWVNSTIFGAGIVLYDAFEVKLRPVGEKLKLTALGEPAALYGGQVAKFDTTVDAATLPEALDTLETWCRSQLPPAYLEARAAATPHEWPVGAAGDSRLGFDELVDLTREWWGERLTGVTLDGELLRATLYGVFAFSSQLERYGIFGAGLAVNGRYPMRDYLGVASSLNNNPTSITGLYAAIDRWCLVRLPAELQPVS